MRRRDCLGEYQIQDRWVHIFLEAQGQWDVQLREGGGVSRAPQNWGGGGPSQWLWSRVLVRTCRKHLDSGLVLRWWALPSTQRRVSGHVVHEQQGVPGRGQGGPLKSGREMPKELWACRHQSAEGGATEYSSLGEQTKKGSRKKGRAARNQPRKSQGIPGHCCSNNGVAYLPGTLPIVPTRWVFGGRCHCCLICAHRQFRR